MTREKTTSALARRVRKSQTDDRACPHPDYTVISSPIDGKIGRTAVTEGNVVGPGSGVLTTIVSQTPMYVTFPVPLRQGLEMRERYGRREVSRRW